MAELFKSFHAALQQSEFQRDTAQVRLLRDLHEQYFELVNRGIIKELPLGETVNRALAIHAAGVGTMPDIVTVEEIKALNEKTTQAVWADAIRRLPMPVKRDFMGVIGNLYRYGNRSLFHSQLKVDPPELVQTVSHLFAKPEYTMNPDVKSIGWIRKQPLAKLITLDGIHIRNAVFLRVCLGESPSIATSPLRYVPE